MKVIGFNGSPRKNGNTATIVRAVLRGAESRGATARLVNLHELQVKGCQGCEACKEYLGRCAQNDDLSRILLELTQYDAIVLGTPVYWWHVNPQFKMLTDRFYCFFSGEVNPETAEVRYETAFPQGKKFAVVTSRGEKENVKLFPELYGYLSEWLKMLTTLMGASSMEFVFHCGSIWSPARNDAALLAKAESIGASLV